MDRVAQLAEEADFQLLCEVWEDDPKSREATRAVLADAARELGFPENEISAAIDTALAGR